MTTKKEANINFKLNQKDKDLIETIAKKQDRKVGYIVRNLVLDFLKAHHYKKTTKATIGTHYLIKIGECAKEKGQDLQDYSLGAYNLDLILEVINNNNIKLSFNLEEDTNNIIKHIGQD